MTTSLPPLVEPGPALTEEEKRRYARQILLPFIGLEGQQRLKNARVLCVGAGGLGSPALLYLAAAGVGTIGVVDDDRVDETNLQRQVIHTTAAVGELKVESAARAIRGLNPLLHVKPHSVRLTPDNVLDIVRRYDVILDGADNFPTRYLVSDAAEILGKPVVWGSLLRENGQVAVFWSGRGPTYRDVFPQMPDPSSVPSCAAAGVVGATCAVIGAAMANEAVKLIVGAGESLVGRVQMYDALTARWRELAVGVDPARPRVTRLAVSYEWACATQESPSGEGGREVPLVEPQALESLLNPTVGAEVPVLVDVRTAAERDLDAIPGSQHHPMEELLADPTQLDRSRSYVVHCHSGQRSARVAAALAQQGFTVSDLRGGIVAWRAAQPSAAAHLPDESD